jgi:2-polyprenyl-6-methoxyphenol hydroxylase-like FAD-dependent oxidoreductase
LRQAASVQVLIVGAGPTGLTLACDLARRAVSFRLVDAAPRPFDGSRGKGLQPRTLEVFDDLGVVDAVLAAGGSYPPFRIHLWRMSMRRGGLGGNRPATPEVPYPNLWMIPQWRTEQILRERLRALGGEVELATPLTTFEQDGDGVTASLGRAERVERVRAEFLIGCDGGHSVVRKTLGVRLEGEAVPGRPVVVADVEVEGLERDSWHVWPLARGCMLTLCPLPGTETFQMTATIGRGAVPPDLTEAGIGRLVHRASGHRRLEVGRVSWMSRYQPHVRMVDRYRVRRVFLAGDAAHVHPPAGGQGLNTGVQDAYNLGWKLAQVLRGAPDALLDTYEAERLPIAAAVLGLSKRLQISGSLRRGPESQQLGLHYRGGPLAPDSATALRTLRAGDRAPDAPCRDHRDQQIRLFDVFRGTHFTLLAFGASQADTVARVSARWAGSVRTIRVHEAAPGGGSDGLVDHDGHVHAAYGVRADTLILIRPDGYLGLVVSPGTAREVDQYLAGAVAP